MFIYTPTQNMHFTNPIGKDIILRQLKMPGAKHLGFWKTVALRSYDNK